MQSAQKINKRVLALSAGSHFMLDIYQSFYIGLIPLLVSKFGLSLFQVSLLGATSIIANSLFSPAFGLLSDRYGLKKFMVMGIILTSVFLSLLGVMPHYLLVLIFLFIGNLGIASFHPPSAAMAGYYGGNKKTFSTSLINFGGNFGFALGSLTVILILEKIGIQYTPIAMAGGLIAAWVLIRKLPSDKHIPVTIDPNLPRQRLGAAKIFLLVSLVFTVYSLYILWVSLFNYMPVYYTQGGLNLIPIGIMLFLFGALGGAGGFLTGHLNDRFKKGPLIIQISIAMAIPCLYFIFIPDTLPSMILFVLAGVFLIPIQPVCIRTAQQLWPANIGLASSLILGLSAGLAGLTLIPLGKAADIIGIAALIRAEIGFLLLSVVLLFFYPLVARKVKS